MYQCITSIPSTSVKTDRSIRRKLREERKK